MKPVAPMTSPAKITIGLTLLCAFFYLAGPAAYAFSGHAMKHYLSFLAR